jgi:hypothetical protein
MTLIFLAAWVGLNAAFMLLRLHVTSDTWLRPEAVKFTRPSRPSGYPRLVN